MEEDQGRASPPLPGSRGSYNIDFDALDDSFNPFQTQRHIRNSPPLETKEHNNSTEGEAVAQESHQPASDSRVQESSNSLKETSETPKKRKSNTLVHTHTHAHIHTHTNTHTYTHTHTHMHACIHTHMHAYTHTHIHTHTTD